MKKAIYFIGLICTVFVLSSNRTGTISRRGVAATTAPGENQSYCGSIGCHFGSNFNAELSMSLLNANGEPVEKYIPGQDYSVSLIVNHTGTPAGYGFQIVSLKDSDETSINSFFDIPDYAQESQFMNRQYIEQKNVVPTDEIILNWKAPNVGSGDITFYAAGNAVDGSGDSSNDSGDTIRLTITEDVMSSLINIDSDRSFTFFPNPAKDIITIIAEFNYKQIEIFNLQGQLLNRSKFESKIDVSELEDGLYIIRARNDEGDTQTQRLIKI